MGKIEFEELSSSKRQEYYNENLGPIVHYYLKKLDSYINYLDDGETKFLFLSRAGVRIYKLYDEFLKLNGREVTPHANIFYTSRFLICKALWLERWDLVGPIIQGEYSQRTATDLIKGLFRTEERDYTVGVDFSKTDLLKATEYINAINNKTDYTAYIKNYLDSQNHNFKGYLHKHVKDYKRVVVIDSGWKSTIQHLLSKAFNQYEWKGLMFGTILPENFDSVIKPNVHGLIFEIEYAGEFNSYDPKKPQTALALHRHIVEDIFEPNALSIESIDFVPEEKLFYAPHGDKLYNEDIDPDNDYDYLGIQDYLKENSTLPLIDVQRKFDLASEKLSKKIIHPKKIDLICLGYYGRSSDFGKDDVVNVLINPESRYFGDTPAQRIIDSLWSQGQIALEYDSKNAKKKQRERVEKGFFAEKLKLNEFLTRDHLLNNSIPDVAIITRTKDRPILLKRAAESVASQTYSNYVWIVINDGGELDPVIDVINSSGVDRRRIVLVHNSDSIGMEAASNKAVQSCTSKYIVIHDDDDSWSPKFLEKTVFFMESPTGNKYGAVITGTTYVSEEIQRGNVIIHRKFPYNSWVKQVHLMEMSCGNIFAPIAFLFKREIYGVIEGFDESLPVLGDWDFNLRFLLKADIGVLNDVLANYHHRDVNAVNNVYSNSVVGGISKHLEYEPIVRNKFFRLALNEANSNNAGLLVNLGYILKTIRAGVQDIGHKTMSPSNAAQHTGNFSQMKELDYFQRISDLRWFKLNNNGRVKKIVGLGGIEFQVNRKVKTDNLYPADWDEEKYLINNVDVNTAVKKGDFPSGFYHYVFFGMKEGRRRFTHNVISSNEDLYKKENIF